VAYHENLLHYGYHDFVICLGFKGYMIKEYFSNYFLHMSDVTIDMQHNSMEVHQKYAEPWKVTLVDTGDGDHDRRQDQARGAYIGKEPFLMTYGDGVSDVNIPNLIEYHQRHGKAATVTATQPSGRFGVMSIGDGERVTSFQEKPAGDGSWINGGSSCSTPVCLTCSRTTVQSLKRNRLSIWRSRSSSWHSNTTGSGTPWTLYATETPGVVVAIGHSTMEGVEIAQ